MIGKYSSINCTRVNLAPENWSGHKGLDRPSEKEFEQMMTSALEFCCLRSDKPLEEIVRLVAVNDLWANSTLRYALAKEIKKVLLADPEVRDLYVFGSVIEDCARLTSDINLILHVKKEREDYEIWFVIVDEGIREQFRERFGIGSGFTTLLDSHVVTDKDISHKAGYASMLSSSHPTVIRLSHSKENKA